MVAINKNGYQVKMLQALLCTPSQCFITSVIDAEEERDSTTSDVTNVFVHNGTGRM